MGQPAWRMPISALRYILLTIAQLQGGRRVYCRWHEACFPLDRRHSLKGSNHDSPMLCMWPNPGRQRLGPPSQAGSARRRGQPRLLPRVRRESVRGDEADTSTQETGTTRPDCSVEIGDRTKRASPRARRDHRGFREDDQRPPSPGRPFSISQAPSLSPRDCRQRIRPIGRTRRTRPIPPAPFPYLKKRIALPRKRWCCPGTARRTTHRIRRERCSRHPPPSSDR